MDHPTTSTASLRRPRGAGRAGLGMTLCAALARTLRPHRFFDARSLAGSSYETTDDHGSSGSGSSSDYDYNDDDDDDDGGETPTLSNPPPPLPIPPSAGGGGGHSSRTPVPPQQPHRCPSRPKAIRRESWDAAQLPDLEVVELLDTKVVLGGRTTSILDAAQPGLGASRGEQPSFGLAVALHNVLKASRLSLDQKRSLFAYLFWKFECFTCGGCKRPGDFRTSYHLWGPRGDDGGPPMPRLRSGPCLQCVDRMRHSRSPDALVAIDVHLPPECVNSK